MKNCILILVQHLEGKINPSILMGQKVYPRFDMREHIKIKPQRKHNLKILKSTWWNVKRLETFRFCLVHLKLCLLMQYIRFYATLYILSMKGVMRSTQMRQNCFLGEWNLPLCSRIHKDISHSIHQECQSCLRWVHKTWMKWFMYHQWITS